MKISIYKTTTSLNIVKKSKNNLQLNRCCSDNVGNYGGSFPLMKNHIIDFPIVLIKL